MTVADLGQFAKGVAAWRKLMAAMPDNETRWEIFDSAAHEIATYVPKGLDRVTAVDQLHDMATAYGLADVDHVQTVIADAFHGVEAPDRIGLEEAPATNGHDKTALIPIVFPFPIKGSEIPQRPWVVPGLLLRRQLSMLVSPPGSGKSLLTLQLGMVCSAGIVWNGWRPRGRSRVLVINSEDDRDEMRRRLFAAREVMGLPDAHLAGLAFAENPETIVVARADSRTKTVTRTPMLEAIVATIITGHFDIVIVDPFAETFAGDENSNSELKWAGMLWREVARRTNAAVLLVHHTKKYAQDMAGDMDAGRGGGSLAGVARVVATLFPMTVKEAEAFKIDPPTDRAKYIRFDDAKANLTLVTFAARWFQKQSYTLPNGEPADEVGVLVPWDAPDPLSGLSTDTVVKIFTEIEKGVTDDVGRPTGDLYSDHANAKDRYVAPVIQRFFECTDKQAKELIAKWVKNEMLEIVEIGMPSAKGGTRKGLKVKHYPGITEQSDQMDLLR